MVRLKLAAAPQIATECITTVFGPCVNINRKRKAQNQRPLIQFVVYESMY